ncbi:MAG TPA: 5,6-dimethylbenzimidazole synthase [Sphingobium sp.]|uniref:5,6-dimethylbenzimidazole synthase n=1 Tax=Sphingobium sp. TaxID=1912891 RepID=UPI002ED46ACA
MNPMRFDAAFIEQFAALIGWRRDVRRFRRDALPEEVVEDLLRLAQMAPSVGNSQPWRFVRIRSADLRETLAAHADAEVAKAGKAISEDRRALYSGLKLHGLREAPEVMAVFCDDATGAGGGLGAATMPEARAYSVVLAIHTLWLAARAQGIALGWVSIVEPSFVAGLLDVPQGWRLVALLCLGLPEEEADVPELERLGWQDRLDWRDHVSER